MHARAWTPAGQTGKDAWLSGAVVSSVRTQLHLPELPTWLGMPFAFQPRMQLAAGKLPWAGLNRQPTSRRDAAAQPSYSTRMQRPTSQERLAGLHTYILLTHVCRAQQQKPNRHRSIGRTATACAL